MRLWQATWDLDGELVIWGEQAQRAPAESTRDLVLDTSDSTASLTGNFTENSTEDDSVEVASDSTQLSSTPIAPHSRPVEDLCADLEELNFSPDRSRNIELFLPTDELGPLTSPKLLLEDEIERLSTASLQRWSTPAIVLEPVTALGLLTSLPNELPAGLVLDDSVLFWREATKLVLELLTRGRFIPGLVRSDNGARAHWHVLPTEKKDHERLSILAENMPPICRALLQKALSKNPEPSALLESFVARASDALIRLFLSRHSLIDGLDRAKLPPRTQLPYLWLQALTKSDSTIAAPDYELLKFEQRMRAWSGSLLSFGETHSLRTCFRVVAPQMKPTEDQEIQEPPWVVEFFLQSTTDETLELTPHEIWKGSMGFLRNSEFTPEDLEELLLQDLGRAHDLFPELRQAHQSTHPTHITLNTNEAYTFLTETAKRLDAHGFGVVLPNWWSTPNTSLGLKLSLEAEKLQKSDQAGFGFLAANQLLDYQWDVAVGDDTISLDEFKKLVQGNSPLVNYRGQWIELEPSKVQSTMAFLERHQHEDKIRFVDALRIGFAVENDKNVLPVVELNTQGWIKQLLESDLHSIDVFGDPEGFGGTLRKYQREGLSWMYFLGQLGIGGCLADDMGLGKTIQLLALLLHERLEYRKTNPGGTPAPTLLVVPMSILTNWEDETNKFCPDFDVYLHHGTARLSGQEFFDRVNNSNLVVTTYNLVYRDEDIMGEVPWARIALDEAQNIKNLEAKQTKAVRRVGRKLMERPGSLQPCHRLALTGTPLENHLEELWSIFDFLNPGFLGSVHEFRARFAVPVERYRDKEAAMALSKLIQPFVLRRVKTDPEVIDDLPEKIEMNVFTSLTQEQASLYQSVIDNMLPQVGAASGMHRKGLVLSTITKLKQICNHPTLYLKDGSPLAGRSGKLERLVEILEVVLAEGDRVLMFSQYAQWGHLLKPYLQERFGGEVLFLHGALPKRSREKVLEKFRNPEGPAIFLLSLKAGGFGLNLTEANQVVHFDQWWNPAVEEQATDRAYRIGQTRNVQVRKFICKGTLEEKIHAMLSHKRDLADQVVGTTKSFVTQLTMDELQNLLQLNA